VSCFSPLLICCFLRLDYQGSLIEGHRVDEAVHEANISNIFINGEPSLSKLQEAIETQIDESGRATDFSGMRLAFSLARWTEDMTITNDNDLAMALEKLQMGTTKITAMLVPKDAPERQPTGTFTYPAVAIPYMEKVSAPYSHQEMKQEEA